MSLPFLQIHLEVSGTLAEPSVGWPPDPGNKFISFSPWRSVCLLHFLMHLLNMRGCTVFTWNILRSIMCSQNAKAREKLVRRRQRSLILIFVVHFLLGRKGSSRLWSNSPQKSLLYKAQFNHKNRYKTCKYIYSTTVVCTKAIKHRLSMSRLQTIPKYLDSRFLRKDQDTL